MRILRAPTVQAGDQITAKVWNQLAGAVNEGLRPPVDLDTGSPDGAADDLVFSEQAGARVTSVKRVENPDDPDQYVNLDRPESVRFWDPEAQRYVVWQYANDE